MVKHDFFDQMLLKHISIADQIIICNLCEILNCVYSCVFIPLKTETCWLKGKLLLFAQKIMKGLDRTYLLEFLINFNYFLNSREIGKDYQNVMIFIFFKLLLKLSQIFLHFWEAVGLDIKYNEIVICKIFLFEGFKCCTLVIGQSL